MSLQMLMHRYDRAEGCLHKGSVKHDELSVKLLVGCRIKHKSEHSRF